jgi:DNA helicase HerA-like ATPase
MEEVLPLGILNFRGKEVKFGIKPKDRLRHIYIIGKTGQGKTTLLENMINFDIQNKNGLAFLDPHGDSVQRILDYIPKERIDDVIYFNPTDVNHPIALIL